MNGCARNTDRMTSSGDGEIFTSVVVSDRLRDVVASSGAVVDADDDAEYGGTSLSRIKYRFRYSQYNFRS